MRKKLTFLFALLCASMMSFAIDWSGYEWLEDGAGAGAYSNKYKVAPAEGQNVVNIQKPGWANEPGIYTSDFGGAISSCTLGDKCAIDGGGIVLYLSAFTAKETEVTVVAAQGSKTFTVYYDADGTTGGGGGGGAFDPSAVNWESSENTTTYHKINDQFQIAAENASNMPSGPLNIQKPAWAAFEGLYVEVPAGVSACAFDDVAVTDGTEYDGNTGAGIVLNPSALTNEITKVTVTHGLGNTIFYVHNANAGAAAFDPENIEWAGVEPVTNSDGHYKITAENDANMPSDIVKQQNVGWAENHAGIYVTVPAGISKVEINGIGTVGVDHTYCWINGAGVLLYQEAFTSAVSEVVVTYAGGSKTFYVWTDTPNDTPINPYPSGGNSYCGYTDNDMKANDANVCLTWATADNGDVVINITDGLNASNSSFRNGGFENEISFDDSWKVYSGTNYGTIEPASTYFETGTLSNGDKTFTLALKTGKTVPDNAIVAFKGHAFSWKNDQKADAYHFNKYFAYNYGTNCSYLDVPTNVAVTDAGVITFTGSEQAESYTALVYLDGILKHRQTVTSGATLTYIPYTTGTYQVRVTASAEGYPTTEPSDPANWNLTATPVVVGNSEYCEAALPRDQDKDANFSWETDNSGNMTITLLPLSGQTATFRKEGMKLTDFTVGSNRTAASEYFDRVYSEGGTTVVLNLKNASIKPGQGEPIYFNGYVECLVDGTDTWPTANLTYTYGSKCTGKKRVTVSVNNADMGAATVDGVASKDVDPETQVTCVAHPNDGFEFVNWTIGGVEVSTKATYQPTINTATDLVANFDYARTTYCHQAVTTNGGKKLYLTVGKGATEGTYQIKIYGSDELTITGINNANTAVNYVKYLTYDGNDVPLTKDNGGWSFEATGYGVISSAEIRPQTNHTWRDIWMWRPDLYIGTSAGEQNINGVLNQENHFNWNSTCSDTEAPVFDKAKAEVLSESSVRLKIQATDNWGGLLTYTIARADAVPIISNHASGEEFTQNVDGLTAGTEYTFTVTVSDGVNYVSQNILVTPVGDTEDPVITSFTATASYGYVDLAMTATDDMAGDLTYTITYGTDNVDVVGAAGSETTKRIFVLPNTSLSFSVVATDAASHTSAAAVADATTLTIPASHIPTHEAVSVLSVFSNTYDPAVAAGFNRTNWGSAPVAVESDYILYSMTSNVIVWGNNDGNPGYGNIDGLSGHTYADKPGLDVSGMKYIHFDIFCDAANQLNTVNINDQEVSIPTARTIAGEWVSFDVDITGVALEDRQNVRWLKFHPFNTVNCIAAIDNVYFWKEPEEITISEDANNESILAEKDGMWANVTVNRSFTAGNLYTLVLPFDVDAAQTASQLPGQLTKLNNSYLKDNGDLRINFVDAEAVEAGVPYLYTPSADVTNPVFTGVTVSKDLHEPADGYAKYYGIYAPTTGEELKNIPNAYVLGSDQYLYAASVLQDNQPMKALRGYFVLDFSTSGANAPRARVIFNNKETEIATGISDVQSAPVQCTKVLRDGQLLIIRDGRTYNAQGQWIK